ncbi:MAG: hypothetical protein ACTSPM_13075 [Candidatus Heimdallarchaeota archaeon]
MKERNKKRCGFPLIFLLLFLMLISVNSATAKQDTFTLSYGDYYAISSEKEIGRVGGIAWTFVGSNTNVGISVWIFDMGNFTKYSNGVTSLGFEQSNGSYYSAFGTWSPTKTDEWYTVFIHADTNHKQTTTVTADVTIITGGLMAGVLALIIGLPLLITVIGVILVVVLIFRKKNKQQQYPRVSSRINGTTSIVQPQEQPSLQSIAATSDIFCGKCGIRSSSNSTFCGKCGSKLYKP